MSIGILFLKALMLVRFGKAEQPCPPCENWTGTPNTICVSDSDSKKDTTFESYCTAFHHFCLLGSILNNEQDVNKIDFENVLGQLPSLTITEGECADEEKVCPQSCDTVEAKGEPVSVCDLNFVNYRTSCSLAKKLCESNEIEGFTSTELEKMDDNDFSQRIESYFSWRGKCQEFD